MGRRCRACTSTRTTFGDTLKLLGVSAAAPVDESTAANTSAADLEKQLPLLSSQTSVLIHHMNNVKKEIHKLGNQTLLIRRLLARSKRLKFLPGAVVPFVNLLTKANRYFEFKEFADRTPNIESASNSVQLSHILLQDQRLMSMSRKMDESQVMEAAEAIYMELGNQEPEEDPLLSDHIYDLVFQTREKGYHMHRDPMRELKKMMESKSLFYDSCFCRRKLPMEFSDEAIEKACDEYENLVRLMHDKYKKAVGHNKLRYMSSSRKRSFETGVMEEMF